MPYSLKLADLDEAPPLIFFACFAAFLHYLGVAQETKLKSCCFKGAKPQGELSGLVPFWVLSETYALIQGHHCLSGRELKLGLRLPNAKSPILWFRRLNGKERHERPSCYHLHWTRSRSTAP